MGLLIKTMLVIQHVMRLQESGVTFNINGSSKLFRNGKMMTAQFGKLLCNITLFGASIITTTTIQSTIICHYLWKMKLISIGMGMSIQWFTQTTLTAKLNLIHPRPLLTNKHQCYKNFNVRKMLKSTSVIQTLIKSLKRGMLFINSLQVQVEEKHILYVLNNLLQEDLYMLKMPTMDTHRSMLMRMKSKSDSWDQTRIQIKLLNSTTSQFYKIMKILLTGRENLIYS